MVVDTFKISTAQKETDELARKGYRLKIAEAKSTERLEWKDVVVPGLPKGGIRLEAEKVAVPPDIFAYRFVSGSLKMSTMQNEMDSASAEGYRLIPGGWLAVEQKVLGISGLTYLAIMEKPPHGVKRCHYMVLKAYRESSLEKQVQKGTAAGFQLLQKEDYGELHFAIMEKAK